MARPIRKNAGRPPGPDQVAPSSVQTIEARPIQAGRSPPSYQPLAAPAASGRLLDAISRRAAPLLPPAARRLSPRPLPRSSAAAPDRRAVLALVGFQSDV